MKENNENKIKKEDEISKLIKAFPKDIAALDTRQPKNGQTIIISFFFFLMVSLCLGIQHKISS